MSHYSSKGWCNFPLNITTLTYIPIKSPPLLNFCFRCFPTPFFPIDLNPVDALSSPHLAFTPASTLPRPLSPLPLLAPPNSLPPRRPLNSIPYLHLVGRQTPAYPLRPTRRGWGGALPPRPHGGSCPFPPSPHVKRLFAFWLPWLIKLDNHPPGKHFRCYQVNPKWLNAFPFYPFIAALYLFIICFLGIYHLYQARFLFWNPFWIHMASPLSSQFFKHFTISFLCSKFTRENFFVVVSPFFWFFGFLALICLFILFYPEL